MTDSRRQRRIWYAVGGVLVVAFLAYGTTSFKSNLTPYVSFEEASRSARKVQVAGGLVENSTKYWMPLKSCSSLWWTKAGIP